jgi:hypothetical protein
LFVRGSTAQSDAHEHGFEAVSFASPRTGDQGI